MKVESTTTRSASAVRSARGGAVTPAQVAAAGAPARSHAIADTTTVVGIPDIELTPKVRDAIMTLLGEVEDLRRQLRESQNRLQYLEKLADEDPLAPIANRRAFIRELSRIISYSQRYRVPASVLFFDLNGLKAINDSHGHTAGDAVLVHVANLLIENIRGSDLVGRLGGDEFGVILTNADQDAANEKAEFLTEAIEAQPIEWHGTMIPISVAHGAYCFRTGEDSTSALAAADRAMYQNKRGARG